MVLTFFRSFISNTFVAIASLIVSTALANSVNPESDRPLLPVKKSERVLISLMQTEGVVIRVLRDADGIEKYEVLPDSTDRMITLKRDEFFKAVIAYSRDGFETVRPQDLVLDRSPKHLGKPTAQIKRVYENGLTLVQTFAEGNKKSIRYIRRENYEKVVEQFSPGNDAVAFHAGQKIFLDTKEEQNLVGWIEFVSEKGTLRFNYRDSKGVMSRTTQDHLAVRRPSPIVYWEGYDSDLCVQYFGQIARTLPR